MLVPNIKLVYARFFCVLLLVSIFTFAFGKSFAQDTDSVPIISANIHRIEVAAPISEKFGPYDDVSIEVLVHLQFTANIKHSEVSESEYRNNLNGIEQFLSRSLYLNGLNDEDKFSQNRSIKFRTIRSVLPSYRDFKNHYSEENNSTSKFLEGVIEYSLIIPPTNSSFFDRMRERKYTVFVDSKGEFGARSSNSLNYVVSGRKLSDYLYYLMILSGIVAYSLSFRRFYLKRRENLEEVKTKDLFTSKPNETKISESNNHLQSNENVLRHPNVPDTLLEAIDSNRCILALGAGASAQAGYPNGVELLQAIVKVFDDRLPIHTQSYISELAERPSSPQSASDFSVAIETILSSISRRELIEVIDNILSSVKPDIGFHKLLDEIEWTGIISLVWDTLADKTMRRHQSEPNPRFETYSLYDGKYLQEAIRERDKFFIRALGDFGNPQTVSLHIEDFRRNISEVPEFQRQTLSLMQSNSLLFVGVGLQTLKSFFESLEYNFTSQLTTHWAIIPFSKRNDVYQEMLKQYGVELIEYDGQSNHHQLNEIIKEIRLRTKVNLFSGRENKDKNSIDSKNRVSKLSLENIGPFSNLEIHFNHFNREEINTTEKSSKVDKSGSRWTVLMGPNGSGKSIIMRSLALALCANDSRITYIGNSLLNFGAEKGLIDLEIITPSGRIKQNTVSLLRDRNRVKLSPSSYSPVESGHLLALGFPSLRGAPSDDPVGASKIDDYPAGPDDLIPLIINGMDTRMEDFKQWIVNILSQSNRDKKSKKIRLLLEEIIGELIPGQFNGFADIGTDFKIYLRKQAKHDPKDIELIEFNSISQGMASIFNWLGVLIQRLYHFYEKHDTPHQKEAIILIDEIDAHLHPEWQRNLIKLTKKIFPNVQVIVSSHSALMAGALHKEEIRMISFDVNKSDYSIEQPQRETFGLSSSELFTDIFEMPTDRNPEIENDIREFHELNQLDKKTKLEEARFDLISDKLRAVEYPGALDLELEDWIAPTAEDILEFDIILKSKKST